MREAEFGSLVREATAKEGLIMETAVFFLVLFLVYARLFAWIRNDMAIKKQAEKRAELKAWRELMAIRLKRESG